MAYDIFDHHHRAVDDHAEVQSAQREQVGGNVAEVEADGGEQQREGNGKRDDDGAAHIAEEEKENDGDEEHARGEVVLDGIHRVLDQIGAVEEGNHFHALGQDAVVQIVDFLVDAQQDGVGVGALLQQGDTFDGVGIVDDLAVVIDLLAVDDCVWLGGLADLPQANLGALRDGGDVLDLDGGAVGVLDDGILDVLDAGEKAQRLHVDLL